MSRSFASDNNSGVHPEILKAITEANLGHCKAYGDDPWTKRAVEKIQQTLGPHAQAFFVFNGTGANVLSLKAMVQPFEAVICASASHIQEDECGAPEANVGCKLLGIPTPDGKLSVDQIRPHLRGLGNPHHVQPKVISITQSTEFGTLYTVKEIQAMTHFARENGLWVHMDGARLSNAAASLKTSLRALTSDAGIDVLSFGGTKNGLVGAEAVVIFRPELALKFQYIQKQSMQLPSKMRFISAQFEALLSNDLWLRSASHANAMAARLEAELRKFPKIQITQKVQANGVFVRMDPQVSEKLLRKHFFYPWGESEYRLMCSFDTTLEDIQAFAADLKEALN